MGELSKKNGAKLENFGEVLFQNLGWELLVQDFEINCINKNHKNKKNKDKKTHGIDLLFKYKNPFNNRFEAIIIECKNRQWKEYTPANLNLWVDELLNTFECSCVSTELSSYLKNCTLVNSVLLFNSSDNEYTEERAIQNRVQINIPKRKIPTMLYVADTFMLEKWYALNKCITEIKKENISEFKFIYPSINESEWTREDVIIPSFLFSDYIFSSHLQEVNLIPNQTNRMEYKNIFCFDKVSNDAVKYLKSMINELQLATHMLNYKFNIYWYPEDCNDVEFIKNLNNSKDMTYEYIPMDNRRISRVEYGN